MLRRRPVTLLLFKGALQWKQPGGGAAHPAAAAAHASGRAARPPAMLRCAWTLCSVPSAVRHLNTPAPLQNAYSVPCTALATILSRRELSTPVNPGGPGASGGGGSTWSGRCGPFTFAAGALLGSIGMALSVPRSASGPAIGGAGQGVQQEGRLAWPRGLCEARERFIYAVSALGETFIKSVSGILRGRS
jgi:hypothetical protein